MEGSSCGGNERGDDVDVESRTDDYFPQGGRFWERRSLGDCA